MLPISFGVPCVESYHTYFEEYLFHDLTFLPQKRLRVMARRFSRGQRNALDGIIVPSRPMVDTLEAYGVTAPLHVLPTGLAERRLTGGSGDIFRLRCGIASKRRMLLYVGRVAFEKNVGFLLEVMATLKATQPDALLVTTGEGPALDALQREASSRGLSQFVRFSGYLDRHSEPHDPRNHS